MNCYLDFEANGITQIKEIISIGVVAETGESFYSLVRPHFKLDNRIKKLTGIPQEEVEIAPSIEQVMMSFYDWISRVLKCEDFPTLCVFGDGDRDFLNCSIALTEDIETKVRLETMREAMKDVSKKIAKKFYRDSIGLRSAYLTMRLSSGEPIEQRHNALEDAEMLKYICEHIDEYELPEGVIPVKVPQVHMNYGKGKKKKGQTTLHGSKKAKSKQAIRQCPKILDKKYEITFIAKKGNRNPKVYSHVKEALGLATVEAFTSGKQKLEVMELIYNAIQTGELVNGWVLTKVD